MTGITRENLESQCWTSEIPYGTREALNLMQVGLLHRQHHLSNMIFEVFLILFNFTIFQNIL